MFSYRKRIVVLAMVCLILLTTACGANVKDDYVVSQALLGNVEVEQLSSNRFTQLEPEGTKPIPEYKLEGYTLVAENDKLALYVKEEVAGIRVVNKESGYVWGALENEDPEDLNHTWASFAQSVVSISYMDSTGASKQIGAGNKNAECDFTYFDGGFTCAVDFGRKVDICLEAKVTLEEDHITFSIDDASIQETGDNYIESLVSQIGSNYNLRVATSDSLVQLSSLRSGVLRMSARELRQEVETACKDMRKYF